MLKTYEFSTLNKEFVFASKYYIIMKLNNCLNSFSRNPIQKLNCRYSNNISPPQIMNFSYWALMLIISYFKLHSKEDNDI